MVVDTGRQIKTIAMLTGEARIKLIFGQLKTSRFLSSIAICLLCKATFESILVLLPDLGCLPGSSAAPVNRSLHLQVTWVELLSNFQLLNFVLLPISYYPTFSLPPHLFNLCPLWLPQLTGHSSSSRVDFVLTRRLPPHVNHGPLQQRTRMAFCTPILL